MKKRYLIPLAIIGYFAYFMNEASTKDKVVQQTSQAAQSKEVDIGKICKATTALVFGRDYNIMSLDKVNEGIAYVHYIRQSDNSRWATKCKVEGNKVIWASNNPDSTGRWRDTPQDEVITFIQNDNVLTLKEKYSDGSEETKLYTLN